MKHLIVLLALIASPLAWAHSDCMGVVETAPHKTNAVDGTTVKVTVITGGPLNQAQSGHVTITNQHGKESIYPIAAGEISQFYENADETSRVWLGFAAYINGSNPVDVRYLGPSVDADKLEQTIRARGPNAAPTGVMHVWKGYGYDSSEQYEFTNIACSVYYDPQ